MAQILVVDDEIGIRELLSEILADEGHQVMLAESAGDARRLRERGRPDLVLLDIWMPDTDGITLLKEWAASGQLTMYSSCVIALTLLLTASGLDVVSAFSAAVASLNNTGPGLGEVGPATTYANLTDVQTWICSFAMLLGRLELFTLLVVLTPAFWRK